MGGLGYQSDAQATLHVSYNSLDEYARTLHRALTEPYPAYEKIGVKVNGEYQQLSTALLQIENEFYGTIRPKRPVRHGERPLVALEERGVEYVEVRCLDLNPFLPVGIDEETIRLIDVFLLHCLWSESPADSPAESAEMRDNQRRVVEGGRRPELSLSRAGDSVSMRAWGEDLLDDCVEIAGHLDRCHGGQRYRQTLSMARQRLSHPELTPSARVIDAMQARREPFSRFALERSFDTRTHFLRRSIEQSVLDRFAEQSRQSIAEQRALEREPHPSFDEFLTRYLALPPPPQSSAQEIR
jgi:glutamate--cysteine ligase